MDTRWRKKTKSNNRAIAANPERYCFYFKQSDIRLDICFHSRLCAFVCIAFGNIQLDNSVHKVITGCYIRSNDVHGSFARLLFDPLQHSRQTPVYHVGKVVTKPDDVLEDPDILWKCQVQSTNKETCRL